MEILNLLSAITIFVFSISAVLSAIEKKFDLFGIAFITFVTSVGGGTMRDLLLGVHPLFWLENNLFFLIILSAIITTFVFKKYLVKYRRLYFIFDTLGISISTILGTQKAIDFGVYPIIAVCFGLITAVFGGIIRDTLTNQIPLILRKEIYASACLTGGLIYVGLYFLNAPSYILYPVPITLITIIRTVAVKYSLSLPVLKLS